MKLSVCLPIVFPNVPMDEAMRQVGAIGYQYAECWQVRDEEVPALRRAMQESGVSLLSIVADDFSLNIPQNRSAWLAALEHTAKRASELGAPYIVTQVGQDSGEPMAVQYASVIDGLRSALGILNAYGVTLLIEPLNTRVDHKGYILEHSSDAFAIVDAVGSPLVRVVYDIYHQQISEGDIIATVTANLDKIVHLHAAANPGRHEIFLGENDYRVIARAIDNAGYHGAMTLEYKPTLAPKESLQATLEYMKCK